MLILLPIALLILALVAFIAGAARGSLVLDYVSIAAGALAFLVVVATARTSRAGAAPPAGVNTPDEPGLPRTER